jgi:hypothetical protein
MSTTTRVSAVSGRLLRAGWPRQTGVRRRDNSLAVSVVSGCPATSRLQNRLRRDRGLRAQDAIRRLGADDFRLVSGQSGIVGVCEVRYFPNLPVLRPPAGEAVFTPLRLKMFLALALACGPSGVCRRIVSIWSAPSSASTLATGRCGHRRCRVEEAHVTELTSLLRESPSEDQHQGAISPVIRAIGAAINRHRERRSGASVVKNLQQVIGSALDRLVPPLGCPVQARNDAYAMQAAEVPVDERVLRLGVIGRPLGQPEMPSRVLLPGGAIVKTCGSRSLSGFRLSFLSGPLHEFPVDEGRSGPDQGDEVRCVDGTPAVLC